MHGNLPQLVATQRIADQVRVAERARLASEARAQRRDPPNAQAIVTVTIRLCRMAARLSN